MFWAWHYSSAPSGDFRAHLRDWEAAREGIDDLRYLATLERLVANLADSIRIGSAAVVDARLVGEERGLRWAA